MDQTFGVNWSGGAAPSISSRPTITGTVEGGFRYSAAEGTALAGGATNNRKQIGFDAATLKGVIIRVSGNDGAVTIKTNDTGSPAHTFTFAAGGGEIYWTNRVPTQIASPFGSTDVTDFYLTNAGTADADVDCRFLT